MTQVGLMMLAMDEETQHESRPHRDGVTIAPVGPASWDDVVTLFGPKGAFGGCWCMFWRQTNRETNDASPNENRASLQRLVTSGEPVGVLARRDGEVLGWCQVAPRDQFPRLPRTRGLALSDDEDDEVWSIVCVFVDRSARGQGIAGALVSGAVDLARRRGATVVEAYPVVQFTRRTAKLSSGTEGLFSRAGFRGGSRSAGSRVVMTLPLDKDVR